MKPTLDLNAPRMRKGKFTYTLIRKALWRRFRRENKEYKDYTDIQLNKLWADIAQTIQEEVVHNPLGVKLGQYTGEIKYQYLPYKMPSVDGKASQEVGYRVNNVNLNTRGKSGKIKWERRWAVKFNKMLQYYGFQAPFKLINAVKKHTLENPEKIRVGRNTLGGWSVWRQYK